MLTPSSLAQDEVNEVTDENVVIDPATNKTGQRGERSKKVVWANFSTLG
jgi:hypothetical protein